MGLLGKYLQYDGILTWAHLLYASMVSMYWMRSEMFDGGMAARDSWIVLVIVNLCV